MSCSSHKTTTDFIQIQWMLNFQIRACKALDTCPWTWICSELTFRYLCCHVLHQDIKHDEWWHLPISPCCIDTLYLYSLYFLIKPRVDSDSALSYAAIGFDCWGTSHDGQRFSLLLFIFVFHHQCLILLDIFLWVSVLSRSAGSHWLWL